MCPPFCSCEVFDCVVLKRRTATGIRPSSGVTALACDGARLLTGNAEGRVLFQDFSAATVPMETAQQRDATREDQHGTGGSRFWCRPR